jgi:hypothetical protein
MIMGFEFPTQSVQATPSKVIQINPSQPVQSGGKFTWTKQ